MLLNNDLPEAWLGLEKVRKWKSMFKSWSCSHKSCWRNPRAIWPWLKCFLMLLGGTERNTASKVSNGWRTLIISTYTQTVQLDAFPAFQKEKVVIESLHAVALFKGARHSRRVLHIRKLPFCSKFSTPEVGSVPGNILTAVDTGMNDKLREGFRWLNAHFLQLISELWVKQLISLAESKKAKKRTRWKGLTSKDTEMKRVSST